MFILVHNTGQHSLSCRWVCTGKKKRKKKQEDGQSIVKAKLVVRRFEEHVSDAGTRDLSRGVCVFLCVYNPGEGNSPNLHDSRRQVWRLVTQLFIKPLNFVLLLDGRILVFWRRYLRV